MIRTQKQLMFSLSKCILERNPLPHSNRWWRYNVNVNISLVLCLIFISCMLITYCILISIAKTNMYNWIKWNILLCWIYIPKLFWLRNKLLDESGYIYFKKADILKLLLGADTGYLEEYISIRCFELKRGLLLFWVFIALYLANCLSTLVL